MFQVAGIPYECINTCGFYSAELPDGSKFCNLCRGSEMYQAVLEEIVKAKEQDEKTYRHCGH